MTGVSWGRNSHVVVIITGETIVWPSDYVLRLVFFYSGAVRGLLLDRSIPTSDIPNCSDLLWVEIAALWFSLRHFRFSWRPKKCAFFTFSVVKSKLMIRFEKIRRHRTRDIIYQNSKQICDVISGFYFELKSAIFCSFQLLTSKLAWLSQNKSGPALRTASLIQNI